MPYMDPMGIVRVYLYPTENRHVLSGELGFVVSY